MMRRTFAIFLFSCSLAAGQSPNPFDKPPADVDDALRARVTEFYNLQVQKKYRPAEQLVAESARDDYFAAGKDKLQDFRIDQITYMESYKMAKVTMVGKMLVTFFGIAAPQLMDVPFPSFWKFENGKWFFFYYVDPNHMTPFGKQKAPVAGSKADPMAFQPVDLSTISRGVKPDRTSVKLTDSPEKVVLTNVLPGSVTLSLSEKEYSGIEAKLDKTILKAGEVAVLTVRPTTPVGRPRTIVGIMVSPSNQLIQVEIK